jgi:hypothetical protein
MTGNREHREFVDTNILICAFDLTAGDKRRVASDLITRLWMARNGCISLQVLQEFYVIATKKLRLSPDEAMLQIRRLGLWQVHFGFCIRKVEASPVGRAILPANPLSSGFCPGLHISRGFDCV